jgi:predicted SnoaL-like aldol condensation-catalyzing enzyme
MKETIHKKLIKNYIENIWNQEKFEDILVYTHPDFIDHSLPKQLPPNTEGLVLWIMGTSKSFRHKTLIEDMVCEDDKVMIKIRMQMTHIGVWRTIAPTQKEISTVGYRHFRLQNGRIMEHWALIDGAAIENQLKEASIGCKIQE